MRLTTKAGVTVDVGRVNRQIIDDYILGNPAPTPPQIEVTVFGGAKELVDDLDDPVYTRQLIKYYLTMARAEFDMVACAITLVQPDEHDWVKDSRVDELNSIGVPIGSITEYLRYIALAEDGDLAEATELLLYQSTVTDRGIKEAERAFSISYQGIPLSQHPNPPSNVNISAVYQARSAAVEHNYTWEQFAQLDGPSQSAVVAHYQSSSKLRWLQDREHERRIEQQTRRARR